MAQEADFYTAEEAAKVLGIPVRRVFGMLCGGELEGYQDEWARWLVPASTLQGARRNPKSASYQDGLPKHDAGYSAATEDETRVQDASGTTVLSDGRPFSEPPVDVNSQGEETTQEADETPIGGARISMESINAETAETLPLKGRAGGANSNGAPDGTVKEITGQLAAAAAKTRELRARLELAEITEDALRERIERERLGIDGESTQAEQDEAVAERLVREPADGRGDGFWRDWFGG